MRDERALRLSVHAARIAGTRGRGRRSKAKEECAMKPTGILIAAAMLLLPTAALATPGMVTTNVSLRAGPGDGFPVVDRIPGGSHVNIHGCLKGDAWCDISWADDRGWVSSDELQWLYRNNYVYLSDYYNE